MTSIINIQQVRSPDAFREPKVHTKLSTTFYVTEEWEVMNRWMQQTIGFETFLWWDLVKTSSAFCTRQTHALIWYVMWFSELTRARSQKRQVTWHVSEKFLAWEVSRRQVLQKSCAHYDTAEKVAVFSTSS